MFIKAVARVVSPGIGIDEQSLRTLPRRRSPPASASSSPPLRDWLAGWPFGLRGFEPRADRLGVALLAACLVRAAARDPLAHRSLRRAFHALLAVGGIALLALAQGLFEVAGASRLVGRRGLVVGDRPGDRFGDRCRSLAPRPPRLLLVRRRRRGAIHLRRHDMVEGRADIFGVPVASQPQRQGRLRQSEPLRALGGGRAVGLAGLDPAGPASGSRARSSTARALAGPRVADRALGSSWRPGALRFALGRGVRVRRHRASAGALDGLRPKTARPGDDARPGGPGSCSGAGDRRRPGPGVESRHQRWRTAPPAPCSVWCAAGGLGNDGQPRSSAPLVGVGFGAFLDAFPQAADRPFAGVSGTRAQRLARVGSSPSAAGFALAGCALVPPPPAHCGSCRAVARSEDRGRRGGLLCALGCCWRSSFLQFALLAPGNALSLALLLGAARRALSLVLSPRLARLRRDLVCRMKSRKRRPGVPGARRRHRSPRACERGSQGRRHRLGSPVGRSPRRSVGRPARSATSRPS